MQKPVFIHQMFPLNQILIADGNLLYAQYKSKSEKQILKGYVELYAKLGFSNCKLRWIHSKKDVIETIKGSKREINYLKNHKLVLYPPIMRASIGQKPSSPNTSKIIELSRKYNSKIFGKEIAKSLKIPVFESWSSKEKKSGFPEGKYIIKPEFGGGGLNTLIANSSQEAELAVKKLSKKRNACLIEKFFTGKIDAVIGANFYVSKDSVEETITSKQIIEDEKHYRGNFFDDSFDFSKAKEYAFRIAQQAQNEGYVGFFGVDFLKSGEDVFFLEINARVNAVTVPGLLRKKLGRKCMACALIPVSRLINAKGFENIASGLLFDKKSKEGVLPFNVVLNDPYFGSCIGFIVIYDDFNKAVQAYDLMAKKIKNKS